MTRSPANANHDEDRPVWRTPMVPLEVIVGGRRVTLHLKVEASNPTGSIKDRTARKIVECLRADGRLRRDSILVDSSSGAFGVALSAVGRQLGYPVTVVVDPNLSPDFARKLGALGATVERVRSSERDGNHLAARLERVRELCASSSRYVWANQYANPAVPAVHVETTGPEISEQMDGSVDTMFIAVSTCGTIAGLGTYARRELPRTRIVGVDAVGSVALGGTRGTRLLTGIGSHRPPDFEVDHLIDECVYVSDVEAFATCWSLWRSAGLQLGGSSGAVVFAAAKCAAEGDVGRAVCVCPDTGLNYLSTLYSETWLLGRGIGLPDRPPEPIAAIGRVTSRTSPAAMTTGLR